MVNQYNIVKLSTCIESIDSCEKDMNGLNSTLLRWIKLYFTGKDLIGLCIKTKLYLIPTLLSLWLATLHTLFWLGQAIYFCRVISWTVELSKQSNKWLIYIYIQLYKRESFPFELRIHCMTLLFNLIRMILLWVILPFRPSIFTSFFFHILQWLWYYLFFFFVTHLEIISAKDISTKTEIIL